MSRKIKDKFYQEFHINCIQTWDNIPINSVIDWEWTVPVPRPLETPPSGTYWAIEIHSITAWRTRLWREDALAENYWGITSQAKSGKTPFVTWAGDPENIYYSEDDVFTGAAVGVFWPTRNTQGTDTTHYTDDSGHGKIIIPENIYIQNRNVYWTQTNEYPDPPVLSASIQYTFTTITCAEFLQEVVAQI